MGEAPRGLLAPALGPAPPPNAPFRPVFSLFGPGISVGLGLPPNESKEGLSYCQEATSNEDSHASPWVPKRSDVCLASEKAKRSTKAVGSNPVSFLFICSHNPSYVFMFMWRLLSPPTIIGAQDGYPVRHMGCISGQADDGGVRLGAAFRTPWTVHCVGPSLESEVQPNDTSHSQEASCGNSHAAPESRQAAYCNEIYLPIRSHDCLETTDGGSVLGALLADCRLIVIEDADLRPVDLARHYRDFGGLHGSSARDMTQAMGLRGLFSYAMFNAGDPHVSSLKGERLW